jgi:hypothetical protein
MLRKNTLNYLQTTELNKTRINFPAHLLIAAAVTGARSVGALHADRGYTDTRAVTTGKHQGTDVTTETDVRDVPAPRHHMREGGINSISRQTWGKGEEAVVDLER